MPKLSSIRINEYSYRLPDEAIAKYPLADRSASRLLLYKGGNIAQARFSTLPEQLPQDSWMVFNNTRVIQARLNFKKETGAQIEIFCLEPLDPADYELAFQAENRATWQCLVGNAKKWKGGPVFLSTRIRDEEVMLEAQLLERKGDGFIISFRWSNSGRWWSCPRGAFGSC